MTTKLIACVGQRDLPQYMHGVLVSAGMYYVQQGHVVLSGNAIGADQAYALGASTADPTRVELFLPWQSYEEKAIIYGNRVHYAVDATPDEQDLATEAYLRDWSKLPKPKRLLMIRNAMVASHCDMLIAYPNKTRRGWAGTGHAMRCAQLLDKRVWLATDNRWWTIQEGMPIT